VAPRNGADDVELVVGAGVLDGDLGRADRVRAIGDGHGSLEEGVPSLAGAAVHGLGRQRVLDDLQLGAFPAQAPPQVGQLRDGEAHVVGDDHRAGAVEDAAQRVDRLSLLGTIHEALL
jgi:hypothetical protein